jgi:excinuclease ABC subunit B
MSATPGPYEFERSQQVVEQLIRPTGVVDPKITVKPTEGQIDDLLELIRGRVERGERSIVTTLTKKMAEDLADYLRELGVKVQYLHSEVDTLERVQILRDLRLGVYDVIVGINLLREGIDLPEVTLVAILDADKEGFLRSSWSLIQMIGRAARNTEGEVVMYADRITESMRIAIDETDRRRTVQETYNTAHNISPVTIVKSIRDINDRLRAVAEAHGTYKTGPGQERALSELAKNEVEKLVAQMEAEMRQAARDLEFERAAALRDEIQEVRLRVLEEDASAAVARAAERAAKNGSAGLSGSQPAPARAGRTIKPIRDAQRRGRGAGSGDDHGPEGPDLEVTDVRVMPAGEEPGADAETSADTASDWLVGIRDEHEDDGWAAKWLERPTWDHTVTPNVIKRTGARSPRRRR